MHSPNNYHEGRVGVSRRSILLAGSLAVVTRANCYSSDANLIAEGVLKHIAAILC